MWLAQVGQSRNERIAITAPQTPVLASTVSFTGTTSTTTNQITGCSSLPPVGATLSGTGIGSGVWVVQASGGTVTMSAVGTANGSATIAAKTYTQQISAFRAVLSGKALPPATPAVASANDDIGVGTQQVSLGGGANVTALTILDADSNAIAFARTTAQVLSIVTGGGVQGGPAKGVFFPAGLNGNIK